MRYSKIFVDFDETLTESINAIMEIVGKEYGVYSFYKPLKWDFSDIYPFLSARELEQKFDSDEFFETLKLKPYALEVLSELSKEYEISVVTVASSISLPKKKIFIEKNLPFIKEVVGISHGESKSSVDMSGAIFFDDVEKNLNDSNATKKVLFENVPGAEWNKNWNGEKVREWPEVYKFFVQNDY